MWASPWLPPSRPLLLCVSLVIELIARGCAPEMWPEDLRFVKGKKEGVAVARSTRFQVLFLSLHVDAVPPVGSEAVRNP